jgi:type II secretory pathway pseudopilin PulG
MMRLSRKQAGDTIVEVLIAMAVAAGVLGGAYAVVNRTLQNARQAQEHSEALQIARSQVERIGALARSNPGALFSVVNTFHCIDSAGTLQPLTGTSTLPADESIYPAGCKNLGSVDYRTAFRYDSAQHLFRVYVNWPSVTGNGDDGINLSYKAYQ